MPLICYTPRNFKPDSLRMIDEARAIIEEYQEQGFVLTARQLFYQFVSRDLIANTQKNYKKLCSVVDDAKNAGMLDWEALEDRTRFERKEPSWDGAHEIVEACAQQFHINRWQDQDYELMALIEKDALVGVIEGVCKKFDIRYMACRGYMSGSAQWRIGQWAIGVTESGRKPVILHLGDHDPSGLDMTRDNYEKANLYGMAEEVRDTFPFEDSKEAQKVWATKHIIEVRRLALNMDQVRQYRPPPNPAKETDSRHTEYVAKYGTTSSWELDALEPKVIAALISVNAKEFIDQTRWDDTEARENVHKEALLKASKRLKKLQ